MLKSQQQQGQNSLQQQALSHHSHAELRIETIRTVIEEQRIQIDKKVKRLTNSILNQRKYRKYKKQLEDRVKSFKRYSTHIMNQFFMMIMNEEIISLSTEASILQKIQKLKKSIFTILNRIHLNLGAQDQESELEKTEKLSNGQERKPSNQNQDYQFDQEVRQKSKGKNTKINNESVVQMNIWLLKNFENPYPSLQEKSQMAKKSGLSLVQVNNWFINARQRVIKKYQCKQPQLM